MENIFPRGSQGFALEVISPCYPLKMKRKPGTQGPACPEGRVYFTWMVTVPIPWLVRLGGRASCGGEAWGLGGLEAGRLLLSHVLELGSLSFPIREEQHAGQGAQTH